MKKLTKIAVQCRYEHITEKNFLFENIDVLNGQFSLEPWHLLKAHYEARGVEVVTLDSVEDLSTIDVILFIDRPRNSTPAIDSVLRTDHILKILILCESPPIAPDNWEVQYHKNFNYVFTWADDLVDGTFYIKSNFCGLEVERNDFHELQKKHDDRKLLCMINSFVLPNERYPKNELYSSRIAFIRFMESTAPSDFDLFGNNWPPEYFMSYKGRSENKFKTYANYKFCFCFENFAGYNGYISEKILDCFAAGIVPVYFGAPNIADWIPKSCFVDFRDFNSFESLLLGLRNMPKAEYFDKLNAIKLFWTDVSRNYFATGNFLKNLYEYIDWHRMPAAHLGAPFPGADAGFRVTRDLYQHKISPLHRTPLPKQKDDHSIYLRLGSPKSSPPHHPDILLLIGWDVDYQMYKDCKRAWDFLLDRNPWLNFLFVDWNNSLERGDYFTDGRRLSIGCKPISNSAIDSAPGYYQSGVWNSKENDMSVFRFAKTLEIALRRFPRVKQLWHSTITSIISPLAMRQLSSMLPATNLYAGYPGTLRSGTYQGINIIHGATPILSRDVAQKVVDRFKEGSPDNLIPNDHWLGVMLQDVARTPMPLFVFEKPRQLPAGIDDVYGTTQKMLSIGFHQFRVKTKTAENSGYDRTVVDPRVLMRIAEAIDDSQCCDEETVVTLQNHVVDCCIPETSVHRKIPFNDLEI